MKEWYFEVIYFNSNRMLYDVADGIITLATSIKAMTEEQAQHAVEIEAEHNPLTKDGWFVRVTACDRVHAMKIAKTAKNGFI
jgi:hypothetical protein